MKDHELRMYEIRCSKMVCFKICGQSEDHIK